MRPLLIVGFFLLLIFTRFFALSHHPPGLYWDEQDTGYQAYSLLKTGRDYFGRSLPVHLHALAEYRTPLYQYLTVPAVWLFGLTPLAVRLPVAILGLIGIFLFWRLSRMLVPLGPLSWLAPVILAFSPWHLFLSRVAFEAVPMLTFFLLGLIGFFLSRTRVTYVYLAAFGFATAVWTYSPAKLFVPLTLLTLGLLYLRRMGIKFFVRLIFVFALLCAPIYYDSFFGSAGLRFNELSVFTNPGTASTVNTKRLESALSRGQKPSVGLQPAAIDKLVYNKLSLWAANLVGNYIDSFSTRFLFSQGDAQIRHSPGLSTIGQFHLQEVIPLTVGLGAFFISPSPLLFSWLIVSPLPAILTRDGGGHALRLIFLLPVLVLLISKGIATLARRYRYFLLPYFSVYFISLSAIFFYYFTTYRSESFRAFNAGFPQAITLAVSQQTHYDRVVLDMKDDSALMAYLFTTRFDPAAFQRMHPLPTIELYPEIMAVPIGNQYFVNPGSRSWSSVDPARFVAGNNLIIASSQLPLLDTYNKRQGTIYYPDSSPAYYYFTVTRLTGLPQP